MPLTGRGSMCLTRVPGVPRDTVCRPRPKAHPLGLSRRHFLLHGADFRVGGLRTVELLVRYPV